MKKETVAKIEDEIKQKTNLPNDIKEKIRKSIFTNMLIAIVVISYFIFLILGSTGNIKNIHTINFNIFSIILLGIAIALFEFAYKKDSGNFTMYGIEALIVALITLFLPYVIFEISEERKKYYLLVSSYIGIYYIIKCIFISLNTKRIYLKEQSDIKDIVKKEKRKIIEQDIEDDEEESKIKTNEDKIKEDKKIESKNKSKTNQTRKSVKTEGTKESKPKKTEKLLEIETKQNEAPKKRGRPKKQVEQKQEIQKENTPNKSKKTNKQVNNKETKTENTNAPKKRGRPKKQEVVEKEKQKTEEQKIENVPKKRGRPRKVVAE